MTTKVLTENQISDMKENGVTVIFNGCEVEAAKAVSYTHLRAHET